MKKRQQRVLMILDSKNLKYEIINVADPNKESDKDFMQNNSTAFGGTACDPNPKHPLPPQIFNDELYCGVRRIFLLFIFHFNCQTKLSNLLNVRIKVL